MEQKEERSFWRRGKEPVIFLVLFLCFFYLFAGRSEEHTSEHQSLSGI